MNNPNIEVVRENIYSAVKAVRLAPPLDRTFKTSSWRQNGSFKEADADLRVLTSAFQPRLLLNGVTSAVFTGMYANQLRRTGTR
jgi:hypothetical protein